MDMDIQKLAADTAAMLAPYLPYLIKGGKAAAKAAFEKLGENFTDLAWDKAKHVWEKIWSKAKQKESARDAIEDAASHPDDKDAQASFRRQLTKLFEADKSLLKFIAENIIIDNSVNISGNIKADTLIIGNDNKVVTHIHGNVYNGPSPHNAQDALRVYRAFMAKMTSSLSLRGIDLEASDPNTQRDIGLADVYIDLNTASSLIEVDENFDSAKNTPTFPEKKSRPLSALEAVIQNQLLVIKGDPGSGKTTFVNYLTYCLSTQQTDRLKRWKKKDADLLPIVVILRDFVRGFKKLPENADPHHLWNFIEKRLKAQNLSAARDPIHEILENGKAILFLDGLDEVASAAQRIFVRDAVHEFAKRFSKNRYVVTCRVLSYTPPKSNEQDLRLAGFPEFELAPFDDEKINAFIDHWYAELTKLSITAPEVASDLKKGLKEAVQRVELGRLAQNPLLLTVMAVVNTHKGRLPDARALLYKETVDILLWQWEQASKGQDGARLRKLMLDAGCADADLEQVICKLAYEAHAQTKANSPDEDTLAGISEWNLQTGLAAINKGDRYWATSVIDIMKVRAGLLIERENSIFTFPHRSFQEFLAGTYLDAKDDFVSRAKELADDPLLWRNPILWAVSRRVYIRGSLDGPLALVAELCPSRAAGNEKKWNKVWLAGDILLEVGLNRVERADSELGKELLPRVKNRLVELVEGSHLSPRERAEAANTLARLGDPRFALEFWNLPNESLFGFVHIPSGEFAMGTTEEDIKDLIKKFGGDEDFYKRETPQHLVSLPDYYLARYPVTVAQFREFTTESGYGPKNQVCLVGSANHPVKNVTWYDAKKYCEWLTEKLKVLAPNRKPNDEAEETFWQGIESGKFIATLPSEAEWEKAVRGTDGRVFPWNKNEITSDHANYDAAHINATSAVGCFPKGKSYYELLDMSGNVWEWTRSLWGKDNALEYYYPYQTDDGRENLDAEKNVARVLRGGAFNAPEGRLRCAYRLRNLPDNGSGYLGFRVVVTEIDLLHKYLRDYSPKNY